MLKSGACKRLILKLLLAASGKLLLPFGSGGNQCHKFTYDSLLLRIPPLPPHTRLTGFMPAVMLWAENHPSLSLIIPIKMSSSHFPSELALQPRNTNCAYGN